MIKKFNDFNIEDVKGGEREHFERELNARKKMRSQKSETNDFSFDDLKDSITTEIENKEDYHITIGKRLIEIGGVKDDEIHVEYQSPEMGKVRIFKPKDDSTDGYYEVNTKIYHTDADDVRNFYHFLSLKLTVNESVRDMMKPKSEEEINEVWQIKINDLFERAYTYTYKIDFNKAQFPRGIWKKCTEKYFLYDNYYIYKDKIIYLEKSDTTFDILYFYKTIEDFKLESEDRINKIKMALKKL